MPKVECELDNIYIDESAELLFKLCNFVSLWNANMVSVKSLKLEKLQREV